MRIAMTGKKELLQKDVYWKGSLTVEACYLLPLIFLLIWNVLYLALYLYNQSVIVQGSYCTALRTERWIGSQEQRIEEAERKYAAAVEQKIAVGRVDREVIVGTDGVTVRSGLTMEAPGGRFFLSIWRGKQEQRADRWEPVSFLRACRKAENIWQIVQTGMG